MSASFALKDIFNPTLVHLFAKQVSEVYPEFDTASFESKVLPSLGALEMKDRSRLIACALHECLPDSINTWRLVLEHLLSTPQSALDQQLGRYNDFFFLPVSDFIATHFPPYWEQSIPLLTHLTERFTAEFAIRPFLSNAPELVMKQMHRWSESDNERHRRLASEGCRPKLPWAAKVPWLNDRPDQIIPILMKLANDSSEYVRKSVANNFNDLSKEHPELVLQHLHILKDLGGKHRLWVIRHGSRTRIKMGDPAYLKLMGYDPTARVMVQLNEHSEKVQFGESLELSIELLNEEKTELPVVLDLIVHFRKANGQLAPKVFKWGMYDLPPGTPSQHTKRLPIKPISTRTYHPGTQAVSVQINGVEHALTEFELIMD